MSFDPSTPEKRPVKDNRNLIYGLLVAALLGTWGYIIYDKSKSNEKIEQLQTQYLNVDSSRNEVQLMYNSSLQRLDSITGANQNLTDNIKTQEGIAGERTREIDKLKEEIKSILTKKNATAAELATARRKIGELNNSITSYIAEIEQLKGENKELQAKNVHITTEKQAVEKTLEESQVVKKQLEDAVDVGSTLHASNISVTPINEKGGGKEKQTTTAKRVDKLRIAFALDGNRIATNGEKELFVCLYGPDGQPISIPAYGSGSFNTREEGEKFFTNKINIVYDKDKGSTVSFDWHQDQSFKTGDYKVEVYHNGFKIGEGITKLKKGGWFS
ncbi:MAG: hypothetical protein ABIX01_03945 [Chitinophagaceae bacterium]